MRIKEHPILSDYNKGREVHFQFDGKDMVGCEGESIAAALKAAGVMVHRYTAKQHKPRGIFCAIGRCTDCVMIVNGRCNAIMLPYVIEYNCAVAEDRMADIARALGFCGATDKQLANALVQGIKDLNTALDIPLSYQAAGVEEALFLETVDSLSEAACGDPCTLFNPRETDAESMKRVLTCCYYGTDVTF